MAARLLVGLHGELAGGLFGGAATSFFYAWAPWPVFRSGLRWKPRWAGIRRSELRDAGILLSGTVGTFAASLWVCFPLGLNPSYAPLASPLVLVWGLMHGPIRTRHDLALFLALTCALHS